MHKESSKLRKITSNIETRGWPGATIASYIHWSETKLNPPSPSKIRCALQSRGPGQAPRCLFLCYFSLCTNVPTCHLWLCALPPCNVQCCLFPLPTASQGSPWKQLSGYAAVLPTVFLVSSVELHILPSQYNNCFAAWIAKDKYYDSYVFLCVYTLCRCPWFIYTYNLYSPVRNAFDTGSIHYRGKWEGVGPYKSRLFWVPNGTRLRARCHFTGRKQESISRAQPPPICPRNGCCPHQKNYAQGRINHRCINSYYLPEPRSAEPHPRPAVLHIPHAVLFILTVIARDLLYRG